VELVVAPKELELAKMLVEALAAPFDPAAFQDSYEQRLRALVESRPPAPVASTATLARQGAPVIDIMEALRKSLQAARKPIQSETAPAKSKTAQRRKRGGR
jgi:DNA end-binding protein Ku